MALLRGPVLAQDTSGNTAAAIAAKEDAEDRYKRLVADLQEVQADNQAMHSEITSLKQEIQNLRDAQSHGPDISGIQDDLKKLAQAIQEVDKKRLEDKDAIAEQINAAVRKLESSLGGNAPPPTIPTPHTGPQDSGKSGGTESPAVENGYSYTIQSGDTLGAVVAAYNKNYKSQGLKTITLRQAMEANPHVNWGRLKVGQKIIIPRPEGG